MGESRGGGRWVAAAVEGDGGGRWQRQREASSLIKIA